MSDFEGRLLLKSLGFSDSGVVCFRRHLSSDFSSTFELWRLLVSLSFSLSVLDCLWRFDLDSDFEDLGSLDLLSFLTVRFVLSLSSLSIVASERCLSKIKVSNCEVKR